MLFHPSCEYAVYWLCINVFSMVSLCLFYGNYWTSPSPVLLQEYDFIVVGSGTAGSLIAHRLAKLGRSHVLLEAGGRGSLLTEVPALGPLVQGSVHDWCYETVPQENACLSMKGHKCKWPSGKIVGGSAVLNNMIHLRGNLTQYAGWFRGKHTLDYIKSQFQYIETHILPVTSVKFNSRLANAILEAASEIGYKIHDLNKNFSSGFMKSPVNQKDGSRWSTSNNLLSDKNSLITNILVEKVLIDDQKVAYGVQCIENGVSRVVLARKGVILAAGAINTPKILLSSGFGPKKHLNEFGIQIIKNLPVGKNLQDHVSTGLDLVLFNQSLDLDASDMLNPFHALSYFIRGKGPLTSPGCEVVGIVSTNKTHSPDLQFMILPVGITSDRGAHLKSALGIKDAVWESYFSKVFAKQTASILPVLLHPKSKGEITLRTKNPHDPPRINPRYLSDNYDVEVLVEGLELVQRFVNTKAMQRLGAYLNPQPYPDCEHLKVFSKQYWGCYVRQLTLTSFHPVGTCKMGHASSSDSVVDFEFKVIGVNRLYVADASVLPDLPSGNINAAIAMMANIFFETHFVHSNRLVKSVCNQMDRFLNVCFKICTES